MTLRAEFRRVVEAGAAFLLCTTIVGSSLFASGQQPDPTRQVAAAVQNAIKLLEAKQYLEFVKTCMRPNEVDELVTKYGSIEKLAAELGANPRMADLLKALQAATNLEPSFNAEGTIATFGFDPPVGRDRSLSLQKISDRCVLRD
jgi:hypothetical protein